VRLVDGATWQRRTKQADVTVSGPAQSLLLTLTRRLPLTDRAIRVDGDADVAPALARQHRAHQRLNETDTPIAKTEGTFGKVGLKDSEIPGVSDERRER
jgi:hypothetical protein